MRLETLRNLQAAGWNLPHFEESKKSRKADTFRNNREEDIAKASNSKWGYGLSSVAVGGAAVAFAPATVVVVGGLALAGFLGLIATSKKLAADRITSATERYLSANENIYYLSSFRGQIASQLKLLDKKSPKDLQGNIAKIHSLWTQLNPFILEIKTTRNGHLILDFIAKKDKLVSALSDLQEQLKAKTITQAQFNKQGAAKIKQIFASFTNEDGIIPKLIRERQLFMGHLHNELVDYVESVR